jgi:aminobenzoyl-glutamate utilization protein B
VRARTRPARRGAAESALDAVELMDIGWNFRREHLRIQQRSHYVITNGGDQPNVVPPNAAVWYYFRETDYATSRRMWEHRRPDGEGRHDDDRHEVSMQVLGSRGRVISTRPSRKPMHANIEKVGPAAVVRSGPDAARRRCSTS